MFANSVKRVAQQNSMTMYNMRAFSVLPKLPKLELTMRTPYNTFFNNFSTFTRVYV